MDHLHAKRYKFANKLVAVVRKWEMLAATKVKMSFSENKSEQENTYNTDFLHKTCN